MNSDLLFSTLGNGLTTEKIKCDILRKGDMNVSLK